MRNLKLHFFALSVLLAVSVSAAAQTSLAMLDGTKIDIQGQNGKVVVLAVGASWLPLSGKQAEYASALAKRYTGRDVVVYFVATDSTSPKSKNFASSNDLQKFTAANKLTITILRDPDGATTLKKFDIDQLPSFVILDKEGNRSGEPFAGIDPKYDVTIAISRAVDRLL